MSLKSIALTLFPQFETNKKVEFRKQVSVPYEGEDLLLQVILQNPNDNQRVILTSLVTDVMPPNSDEWSVQLSNIQKTFSVATSFSAKIAVIVEPVIFDLFTEYATYTDNWDVAVINHDTSLSPDITPPAIFLRFSQFLLKAVSIELPEGIADIFGGAFTPLDGINTGLQM
jgi:hypothetical protein